MVKLNGPMFSLDASGTIANTVTFSKWKGRNYARERVIPSNPKSGGQVGRRAMFKFLTQHWETLATASQATWQNLADQLVVSRFNAYLSGNMTGWHNFLAPSHEFEPGRTFDGSDRAITTASWEENRIDIFSQATTANAQFGFAIFAKLAGAVTPAVGNCIIVELDDDVEDKHTYWTPPEVGTWHFDSQAFSSDGQLMGAGGAQSAVPP